MSLRSAILTQALPHLSRTSFTRAALTSALAQLPAYKGGDTEAVVDTIFGPGRAGPNALVAAWEDAGFEIMRDAAKKPGAGKSILARDVLARRLEWSAGVGDKLVEAYALLSAPTTTPTIPIPPQVLQALSLARRRSQAGQGLGTAANHPNDPLHPANEEDLTFVEAVGGRVPIVTANPAAPAAYAWRIADEAVYATPAVGKGVMREDAGAGVDWYTRRVGLAVAYLSAESHLLQPFPHDADPEGPNPHLPAALNTLRRNLQRMDDLRGLARGVEGAAEDAIGFVELVTRSVAGIVRSRGF